MNVTRIATCVFAAIIVFEGCNAKRPDDTPPAVALPTQGAPVTAYATGKPPIMVVTLPPRAQDPYSLGVPGLLSNCRQIAPSAALSCSNVSLHIANGGGEYDFPGRHAHAPFVSLSWDSGAGSTYALHSVTPRGVTVWAVDEHGNERRGWNGGVTLTIVRGANS